MTPADPHVDELTTLRRQYHHVRESAILLKVPLTSAGVLAALQGPASLAYLSDVIFSPLPDGSLALHPLAVPSRRAVRAARC